MENVRIPWNDWKVVKKLGKGSYGTVYEIERTLGSFTEKSAMKVISIPVDQSSVDAAFAEGYDEDSISSALTVELEQILDEYKTMKELSGNRTIVSCEDVSVVPHNDSVGWDVYIRMELLTPLMNYLKSNSLDPDDICQLGIDICEALVLCEKHGIVHRDVKPDNIFITKDGSFKLGDFGIARTLDHTTNATLAGTERFMAPEVIKREPYGKDVDVYSLGLVLYWLLNGKRMPFLNTDTIPTGEEFEKAQSMRVSGTALARPVNGGEELQDIVLKACEYDRKKRYVSAKEMLEALTFLSRNKTEGLEQKVYPAKSTAVSKNNSKYSETSIGTNAWAEDQTVGINFSGGVIETNYSTQKTMGVQPYNKTRDENAQKQNDFNPVIPESSSKGDFASNVSMRNKRLIVLSIICLVLIVLCLVIKIISKDDSFTSGFMSYFLMVFVFALFFNIKAIRKNRVKTASIGNDAFETISLGSIEWIVLALEGDSVLLLSKDCIEKRAYNNEFTSVTWETCSLRSYLNGTWFENTFSKKEKDNIRPVKVMSFGNDRTDYSKGIITLDRVFLLSMTEVEQYFSTDNARIANINGEATWWWLRTPGYQNNRAAYVRNDGFVGNSGRNVNDRNNGVRPAMYVNLNYLVS